ADRIVHDINGELGALQADANTETDGCFTPPSPSIVHTIEGAIFAVADPTLGPMIDKSVGAARNAYATVRNTVSALASGISSLRGVLAFGSNNAQASAAALSLDGQLHLTSRPTIVLDEQEQVVESAAAEPIQSTHVTTAPNDIPPSASAADLPMPETSPSIPQVMISPGFGGGGGGANSTPVQDSQQEQTSIPSLSITSPLDGEIFGTTSVEFVGTVDAGAVVTVTFSTGSASTTADGAGNWSLPLAFNEGAFQIDVSATDGRGNSSATVSRTITVDLTPPAVPILSVTTCDASLLVGDCLVATTTVDISWGDVAGASYYAVATNGVLGATTSLLSSQAMLADGATSTITVVAYDAAGNAATSTSVDVAAISQPLIINEIGWGGTDTDPTNQWIEIKNASPYTLNLSHVELTRSSGSSIQLSGSLPPTLNQNFLVVAPGDTNFFGAHTLTVNFALATTTAEQLSLVWNSSTTLDVMPAVSTCAGWCAGSHNATLGSNVSGLSDLVSPLSMERKTNTDGALASSWQNTDSYGPWLGTGAGLWGSPGIENSAGLPEAGVYCGSTSNLLAPGAPPGPSFGPGNDCVFLSRFVTGSTFGAVRFGGVFRGDIASSTGGSISLFKGLASGMAVNVQSQDPEPGEHYFFAVWENRSFGNDSFIFNFYFTQGASSTQGIAGPPHGNYVIMPFTYAP
ncbi:MAG: Ig-like domain-containing protein, partial [Candidatus Paceibacterota bacterium]